MEIINKVNSIVHCGRNTGVKQVSTGIEMTRTQSFQTTCYCSDSVTFIMLPVIFLTYANVLRLLILLRGSLPKSGPLDFATKILFLYFLSVKRL